MSHDLQHILRDPSVRDAILASMEDDPTVEALEKEGTDGDEVRSTIEAVSSGKESTLSFQAEAIIRKTGRPVLFVQDQTILPDELERSLKLDLWKTRFETGLPAIAPWLPSVGRIELRGHPRHSWVGTGWLVGPRTIVTNRHVAVAFAYGAGDAFEFRLDPRGRNMRVWLDTVEEHERTAETEFRIQKVLHIEAEPGPDVALLRVAPLDSTDDLPVPPVIPLSRDDPEPDTVVGVVGYAGWDGLRNEADVMDQIFEGVYEVKRLHPGEIMEVADNHMTHDCSTLGGNSGSVIIDFATGHAVGLHFAGQYESRNYAVKASQVRAIMERCGIEPG